MALRPGDTIPDGGVTWRVVDTRHIGFVGDCPVFYERSGLFTPNKTTITTPTRLMVNINNKGYVGTSVTINLNSTSSWDTSSTTYATAANRRGRDFYIYACERDSDSPIFLLSVNSTVPAGYNANNSRKLGGFHCLCEAVGTISGHPLSGYVRGDILPLSVWDLKHRPVADPEGMVYVAGIGKWYDIYLPSWQGGRLVSKFGGTIADGSSSPAFHGEKFAECMGLVGKQLLFRDEFLVVAKGSNENTNILGSSDPGTTGGHQDINNRRMISNYGLEDCCGVMWQWTKDMFEYWPGAEIRSNEEEYPGRGAYWLTGKGITFDYTYNHSQHVDGDNKYGTAIGFPRRCQVGAGWANNYNVIGGSRSFNSQWITAYSVSNNSARGCSEML